MKTSEEGYEIPFIMTYSGKRFELENPEFDIVDIAHALSCSPRYNGHAKYPYTVSQHSVMVVELTERLWREKYEEDVPKMVMREALLHDATEAYLTDVPSPFKQLLPDWKKVDSELDTKLRNWAQTGVKTEIVKHADWLALFIETVDLFPPTSWDAYEDPHGMFREAMIHKAQMKTRIRPMDYARDRAGFMNVWEIVKEEGV